MLLTEQLSGPVSDYLVPTPIESKPPRSDVPPEPEPPKIELPLPPSSEPDEPLKIGFRPPLPKPPKREPEPDPDKIGLRPPLPSPPKRPAPLVEPVKPLLTAPVELVLAIGPLVAVGIVETVCGPVILAIGTGTGIGTGACGAGAATVVFATVLLVEGQVDVDEAVVAAAAGDGAGAGVVSTLAGRVSVLKELGPPIVTEFVIDVPAPGAVIR